MLQYSLRFTGSSSASNLITKFINHFGYFFVCIHDSEFEAKEAEATLVQALKSGVNYIDTAPWYGQGQSEECLGQILKDVPRSAYYIATKVGRYCTDYKNMFDFSAKRTRESVERSLELLGLEYVDVIQVNMNKAIDRKMMYKF